MLWSLLPLICTPLPGPYHCYNSQGEGSGRVLIKSLKEKEIKVIFCIVSFPLPPLCSLLPVSHTHSASHCKCSLLGWIFLDPSATKSSRTPPASLTYKSLVLEWAKKPDIALDFMSLPNFSWKEPALGPPQPLLETGIPCPLLHYLKCCFLCHTGLEVGPAVLRVKVLVSAEWGQSYSFGSFCSWSYLQAMLPQTLGPPDSSCCLHLAPLSSPASVLFRPLAVTPASP